MKQSRKRTVGADVYKRQCEACGGSGKIAEWIPCDACGSNGQCEVPCTAEGCDGGKVLTEDACETCGGTGKVDCTGQFAGAVTAAPTCRATGLMTYACAVCGASYTETLEIDPDAHTWDDGMREP